MAFNFFGALGALGRLLPGYVQGERQAVQDNWQDLSNYNQVQAGQIQNAFDEALFNPRVSQGYDAANNSRLGVYNNELQLLLNQQAYPAAAANAAITGYYQPYLSWANNMGQLGQGLGFVNQYWNPGSQSYFGNQGFPQPQGALGAAMMGGFPGLGTPGFNPQGGAYNIPSILR